MEEIKNEQSADAIKLDEKVVTAEDLEKARADKSVRIVETAPGNYKTVRKLKG